MEPDSLLPDPDDTTDTDTDRLARAVRRAFPSAADRRGGAAIEACELIAAIPGGGPDHVLCVAVGTMRLADNTRHARVMLTPAAHGRTGSRVRLTLRQIDELIDALEDARDMLDRRIGAEQRGGAR